MIKRGRLRRSLKRLLDDIQLQAETNHSVKSYDDDDDDDDKERERFRISNCMKTVIIYCLGW
jgi:hypothetical protein